MEKSIHSTRYRIFLRVLRDSRRRAGLSQQHVAERIGETQTFVSKCEPGARRIDVIELSAFCRAFRISLRQLDSRSSKLTPAHRKLQVTLR
jgi:ribosome-binding protein aMBF1 (putative translation factor)